MSTTKKVQGRPASAAHGLIIAKTFQRAMEFSVTLFPELEVSAVEFFAPQNLSRIVLRRKEIGNKLSRQFHTLHR